MLTDSNFKVGFAEGAQGIAQAVVGIVAARFAGAVSLAPLRHVRACVSIEEQQKLSRRSAFVWLAGSRRL